MVKRETSASRLSASNRMSNQSAEGLRMAHEKSVPSGIRLDLQFNS
jgi:hypothetical protein